jgi:ABC-2 type transport system ATP-binding protein
MIMLMAQAIKIQNLSVTLGSVKALTDVSLNLSRGKLIGFIGPSGAGKTTLIRSIVGRLETPAGAVEVLGQPAGSAGLLKTVTYMPQELSVYADLTVKQNLSYFAKMTGLSGRVAREVVQELMFTVDLVEQADALVSNLSGGQKQRVSLAVAFVGRPELMVLDEPTVGLDPVLRDKLWRLFGRLKADGLTLIISSHSMDEARRCDELVLIRDGQVVAHNSPSDLLKKTGTRSVEQAFLKLAGGDERESH